MRQADLLSGSQNGWQLLEHAKSLDLNSKKSEILAYGLEVARLHPTDVKMLCAVTELFLKTGLTQEASDLCRQATALGSDDAWTYYQLAGSLSKLKFDPEAYQAIQTANRILPSDPAIAARASDLADALGMKEEAIKWAETAYGLDQLNPWRFYHLSGVYLKFGQLAQARTAINAALAIDETQLHFLIRLNEVEAAENGGEYHSRQARAIFSSYYHSSAWGSDESFSGPGSGIIATKVFREEFSKWLYAHPDVKIILDAPCGDFLWMQKVSLPTSMTYIGADIVNDLIMENTRKYGSSNHSFLHLDIAEDTLPPADAWLCRDALIHFPFKFGAKVTQAFQRSKTKYFLSTTFPSAENETDCAFGGYHRVNLSRSPFNLGPPEHLLHDPAEGEQLGRYVGVWSH